MEEKRSSSPQSSPDQEIDGVSQDPGPGGNCALDGGIITIIPGQAPTRDLQTLFDELNDGFYLMNNQGIITFVNQAVLRMYGYDDPRQFLGKPFWELLPPEFRQGAPEKFSQEVAKTGHPEIMELPIVRRDGEQGVAQIKPVILIERGLPVGSCGVIRDVTEQKKMETRLRESEERYRGLYENASDAILTVSEEGVLFDANKMAEELTGYTRAELVGQPLSLLQPPEEQEKRRAIFQDLLRHKNTSRILRVLRKDNKVVPVEITANCAELAGRKLFIGTMRDITARLKVEEDLVKIQKLESVGVLAAGIAHDFNNMLAAVMGNVSMVKAGLDPAGESSRILAEAERACAHATELSSRLLTFARGGDPVCEETEIGGLLRESVNLVLNNSKVVVRFTLADRLPAVKIDRGQLRQVFYNLALNAREAMNQEGTLEIRVDEVCVVAGEGPPLPSGKYLRLEFQDHGMGIAPEDLPKIFDPYFTTKGPGTRKGQGLGLTTCHFIVRKHGGWITAASTPEQGTTFSVLLPSFAPRAALTATGMQSTPGRPRVLVLDDEDQMRTMLVRMLSFIGCEAEAVPEGREALAVFRRAQEAGRPFDLVILDLTVPGGMGGVETLRALRALAPGIRAVISSGYSDNVVMSEHQRYGFRAVLTKPYTIEGLRLVVNKTLAEPG